MRVVDLIYMLIEDWWVILLVIEFIFYPFSTFIGKVFSNVFGWMVPKNKVVYITKEKVYPSVMHHFSDTRIFSTSDGEYSSSKCSTGIIKKSEEIQ